MSGSEPTDLRMVPLALAAWAGAWWACDPSPRAAIAIGLAAVLSCALLARRGARWLAAALLLVLIGVAGLGWARSWQVTSSQPANWADQRAIAELEVVIQSDPKLHPRRGVMPESVSAVAATRIVRARGVQLNQRLPVTIRASGAAGQKLLEVPVGTVVRVQGRLAPVDPGERGAAVVTLRSEPQLVRSADWPSRQVNRLREGLRRSTSHSPPQQAGLLPSLVVGDTSRLDPDLEASFKATGLTHLTAVSGTNLTLTLAFLLGLARWSGVRGRSVRVVGLLGVVVFVVVCRAEPSVVRAAAMGLVALAGLGFAGGRARGLRHASTAVVVLMVVDPWLGRSLGFALSALATVGILWWGGRWAAAMRWAPAWLAESVAVPLAAQLATQVVVTGISGEISVVGLAANALAAPMVGPATLLGLAAAIVALISPTLAGVIAWAGGWCVQPVIWIAQVGGSLPAATWRWPASVAGLGLLAFLCLCAAALVPEVLSRSWLCALLALLLAVGSWHEPRPLGFPGPWRVAFCDVGQGDATVVWVAPGRAILVDTGPEPTATLACLRRLGVRELPLLVLTHYHDDHLGGLAGVLSAFPTGRLVVNPLVTPEGAARAVGQLAAHHGVPLEKARLGHAYQVGAARWQVVGVGAADVLAASGEGESSAENNSSIVSTVEVDGLGVVLPGDAEPAAEQAVVARGWSPGLHVLKMPHHGSSRQDERFWCDSGAVLAVASAGLRNSYGHPSRSALRLADKCGMRVARTDLQGTIAVWREADSLQVRHERQGP